MAFFFALLPTGAWCAALDFAFAVKTVSVSGSTIPVYIYKPKGRGPFPLIVLSHGNPRNPDDRRKIGRDTYREETLTFVEHGAAVAVPIRRGYGDNKNFAEDYRIDCSRPDYYDAGREGAKDIKAAVASFASDRDVDLKRVVLVGHSAGGFASVAAGAGMKVLGVISFAGGRGSNTPGAVTCEQKLLSAMASYGRTSPAPELWIYSRNDKFFGPDLAAALHRAFVGAGGHSQLDLVPPYKDDGHFYIYSPILWSDAVFGFLHEIGFLS